MLAIFCQCVVHFRTFFISLTDTKKSSQRATMKQRPLSKCGAMQYTAAVVITLVRLTQTITFFSFFDNKFVIKLAF